MTVPANASLANFFSDFSGKLPEHELEMLLEASFHREFPERPRLTRQQLHSGATLPEGAWITQARLWAEKRLVSRVPLQQLTREQNFYGRYFGVGAEVLIPRPETEVLVEQVLSWLSTARGVAQLGADVGTGSGIIPITLILEAGDGLKMLATEVSPEALRRAQDNALQLGIPMEAICWITPRDTTDVTGSLLEWIERSKGRLDFLVSNPPYLKRDRGEVDEAVEEYEPALALFAPEGDPLFYYRQISRSARDLLKPGGKVFLELPHERADEIRRLFGEGFEDVRIIPDLAGKSRVLEAKLGPWTR
jgi:release factor glutamine methyltransferase